MQKHIFFLFTIFVFSTMFCSAEEMCLEPLRVIDLDRIPHLKGEDYPPDIIFFSKPGSSSTIPRSEMTSENHLDVYLAIWSRSRKIIWSDRNSKKEDWLPPTIYYESYLTRKQLNDFWREYRKIGAHRYFGHGAINSLSDCCIYVSARWSRNRLINSPQDYLNDSYMIATDFEWPKLTQYNSYNGDIGAIEAWLRLRYNICILIPYRPKEVRDREKVNAVFYFPSPAADPHTQNEELN
jgi:hypothetical protein